LVTEKISIASNKKPRSRMTTRTGPEALRMTALCTGANLDLVKEREQDEESDDHACHENGELLIAQGVAHATHPPFI
jgi:hypothetical protein